MPRSARDSFAKKKPDSRREGLGACERETLEKRETPTQRSSLLGGAALGRVAGQTLRAIFNHAALAGVLEFSLHCESGRRLVSGE